MKENPILILEQSKQKDNVSGTMIYKKNKNNSQPKREETKPNISAFQKQCSQKKNKKTSNIYNSKGETK